MGTLNTSVAAAPGMALTNGIIDSGSLVVTAVMINSTRLPVGTQTYTLNAQTGWGIGDGATIFLPVSGTISVAVAGGATLNGATTTLTRTLGNNLLGYVVISRVAGTNAYSLSGF